MKLEFQTDPFLINEESSFHVIKRHKLHSNTPRPYLSRNGPHLEMGISSTSSALEYVHIEGK
jgi:hypothetical protein